MRKRKSTRQVLTVVVWEAPAGVCCVHFPPMALPALATGAITFALDWNESIHEKA